MSNYGYYGNNAQRGNAPADPPESSSYGGIGDSVQAVSQSMGRVGLNHGSGNAGNSYGNYSGRPASPPGAGPTQAEPAGLTETETSYEQQQYSLSEMDQLNDEADKMKGLGNKHMANQEYTRAYNAYSAALKLSPVGPSSHVYLSNRAAALLSLKRYSAAAVDARRAVALAPTFGKAHARLGQALYFLRDYEGAVAAYEDAVELEPDNSVTWTYLNKARQKLDKQRAKEEARAAAGGGYHEEASIDNTTYFGGAVSVATDPNNSAAVVGLGSRGMAPAGAASPGDNSGHSNGGADGLQDVGAIPMRSPSTTARLQNMIGSQIQTEPMTEHGGPPQRVPVGANGSPLSPLGSPTAQAEAQMAMQASPQSASARGVDESYDTADGQHHDPDYDEAVKLQQRATSYLSHKQYRAAVEEYSAALFLVPDDTILSPQLHIGRAHALNGLKRHDSATNDARMAVKINPTSAEAYSVLAKSLFYSRQFGEAVEAFEDCARRMPGGQLSKFDQAYMRKAEDAYHNEEEASLRTGLNTSYGGGASVATSRMGTGAPVPKLKPPRFVSREQVLTSPSNLPPMPKAWPTQSIGSPTTLQVGPEREVVFFSESMGVKLNRGPDGVVRAISVAPLSAESTIAREGDINAGDVIREAAGVDMRRPITNVMWGDTVALIKLAPRPIKLIVAPEVSPLPHSVREEMAKESGPPLGVSLTPMAGTPTQQPSSNGGNRFDFRGEC